MNADMVKAWGVLEAHRSAAMSVPLRKRFADDPERFKHFSMSFRDLLLDYSKNLVDAEAMTRLFALARAADVEGRRAAMFSGEPINRTENRPVPTTGAPQTVRPGIITGQAVPAPVAAPVQTAANSSPARADTGARPGFDF